MIMHANVAIYVPHPSKQLPLHPPAPTLAHAINVGAQKRSTGSKKNKKKQKDEIETSQFFFLLFWLDGGYLNFGKDFAPPARY